ncbi:MAG: hypothetical protein ACYC5H_18455, partial [Methylovirgula sp.]
MFLLLKPARNVLQRMWFRVASAKTKFAETPANLINTRAPNGGAAATGGFNWPDSSAGLLRTTRHDSSSYAQAIRYLTGVERDAAMDLKSVAIRLPHGLRIA